MDNTFKKGLLVGGIVSAVLLAFSQSKKGQELKERLKTNIEEVYGELEKKMQDLGESTKEVYDRAVEAVVTAYSEKKNLADDAKEYLSKELKDRWNDVQLFYLYTQVKSKFRHAEKITEAAFNDAVDEITEKFGEEKELEKNAIKELKKTLSDKWEEFKKEWKKN